MLLPKESTLFIMGMCLSDGLGMDPRDALNETLELFEIRAITVANAVGLSPSVFSRFRSKKQDMHATTFCKVIASLPRRARFHFYSLIEPDLETPPPPESAPVRVQETPSIYRLDPSRLPPSSFTCYLWQWLSVNRISPAELQTRIAESLPAYALQELLTGREPNPEERQIINNKLAEIAPTDA